MSMEEAKELIKAGENALDTMAENEEEPVRVIALGEIGIGNTTTAAVLYCALLSRQGVTPEQVCGRGAGLDEKGIQRKIEVVRKALNLHAEVVKAGDPMRIMAALGGAENTKVANSATVTPERVLSLFRRYFGYLTFVNFLAFLDSQANGASEVLHQDLCLLHLGTIHFRAHHGAEWHLGSQFLRNPESKCGLTRTGGTSHQ